MKVTKDKALTHTAAVALFDPILWTLLEPDMAIICACLPVLRPFLTALLNSRFLAPARDYFTSSGGSRPRPVNTIETIGGSSLPVAMGRENKGTGVSGSSSFERLKDEEEAEPDLWPSGYASERKVMVGKSRSMERSEIPLETIAVRTVVDWRETRAAP